MTGAGTRPETNGRGKPLVIKMLLIIGSLFIMYVVAVQIWHWARSNLMETGALSLGDLKKTYISEGLLVRDEIVIISPANGELIILAKAGERVRIGDSIAQIKTGASDLGSSTTAQIIATRSGIVSYQIDGLEGVLQPGRMDILEGLDQLLNQLQINEAKNIKNDSQLKDGKLKKVDKGQPVLKIIDNLSPQVILVPVPDGFPPGIIRNGGIISMISEKNEFNGRISEVKVLSGTQHLIVETSNYPAGILNSRKLSLELVGESVSGMLISKSSLVKKGGHEGLYIMNKQRLSWVPVNVEGIVKNKAVISGENMVSGTRYITNPRWLFIWN